MGQVITDPFIGREIGQYRIESRIGGGGMGVVYVALHPVLQHRRAIKLLNERLAADEHREEYRRRFLREARLPAGLEHPNVLPVFDAGEHDGLLYLVLPYIRGADLDALIRKQGQLDLDETVAFLRPIADALDEIHAVGLVHRDVKPPNVLIGEPGATGRRHVYLSDFGIVKALSPDLGTNTQGGLVGTVSYIAPEVWRGEEIDGAADQYGLACTAYECLAGDPPFGHGDWHALMFRHVQEPVPPLTAKRPTLPDAVDDAFARALAKRPSDRFASCRDFIDALAAEAASEDDRADKGLTLRPQTVVAIEHIAAQRTPIEETTEVAATDTAGVETVPAAPPQPSGRGMGIDTGGAASRWRARSIIAAVIAAAAVASVVVVMSLTRPDADGRSDGGQEPSAQTGADERPTSAPSGVGLVNAFDSGTEIVQDSTGTFSVEVPVDWNVDVGPSAVDDPFVAAGPSVESLGLGEAVGFSVTAKSLSLNDDTSERELPALMNRFEAAWAERCSMGVRDDFGPNGLTGIRRVIRSCSDERIPGVLWLGWNEARPDYLIEVQFHLTEEYDRRMLNRVLESIVFEPSEPPLADQTAAWAVAQWEAAELLPGAGALVTSVEISNEHPECPDSHGAEATVVPESPPSYLVFLCKDGDVWAGTGDLTTLT